MSLHTWSWLYLAVYIAVMLGFGWVGRGRVRNADDFATARASYGPLMLALAFASTAASGATFLGLPGLTYRYGLSTLWIAFLYPLGIYGGIVLCQRAIGDYGNLARTRSIPEFLGERYRSELLRISAAVFSLILVFYLAGQLVAGLVMFEMMLGLGHVWALTITTGVLLVYVTLGGAHADILTDGAQGALMVVLALAIVAIFVAGVGAGGLPSLLAKLDAEDAGLLATWNPATSITASPWSAISVALAHVPLGLLPHMGNKLWALKDTRGRSRFVTLALVFGLLLPAITLGGASARAVLGDALPPGGANAALPALFIALFPPWLAALLGIGILAAVMSTADGLVISTSQVFANDIYRRSIVPRLARRPSEAALDRTVLGISRFVTVLTILGSAALGWIVMDMNVVLLVWVGIGGFVAALAGPLVLGSLWSGVTRAGALAGFWTGAVLFVLIHGQIVSGSWLAATRLAAAGRWFDFYATSPYSAAVIAGGVALAVTSGVSLLTRPLPPEHLAEVTAHEHS